MNLSVSNTTKFINNISDYIQTAYNIVPKNFILDDIGDKHPVSYKNGIIKNVICPESRLHLHNDKHIYCSIPERIAITFVHNSIFGEKKNLIVDSIREWLPEVSFDCVDVCFSNSVSKVCSNLFPSYALKFLTKNTCFKSFVYTYIDSGEPKNNLLEEKQKYIENCEKELLSESDFKSWNLFEYKVCNKDLVIMVRARSRSKSRSPSRNRSVSPSNGGKVRKRRTSTKKMTRKNTQTKPRKTTKRNRRRSRSMSS